MIIPDKHLSITSEQSIKNICRELFTTTDINYFVYHRFYDDGSLISLPSNAAWHAYFFEKQYYKTTKDRLKTGVHLWISQDFFSQASIDARDYFNIDYKFEIIERGKDYFEIFGFATYKSNAKIINYYINNAKNLKKFGLYFKDKAWKIITESILEKKKRLLIAGVYKKSHRAGTINTSHSPIENTSSMKNYRLVDEIDGDLQLTKKEMECLWLTVMGRTAKEIAEAYHMGEKTVEWYQSILKIKLNCSTRAELFDKAKKLGILQILDK